LIDVFVRDNAVQ